MDFIKKTTAVSKTAIFAIGLAVAIGLNARANAECLRSPKIAPRPHQFGDEQHPKTKVTMPPLETKTPLAILLKDIKTPADTRELLVNVNFAWVHGLALRKDFYSEDIARKFFGATNFRHDIDDSGGIAMEMWGLDALIKPSTSGTPSAPGPFLSLSRTNIKGLVCGDIEINNANSNAALPNFDGVVAILGEDWEDFVPTYTSPHRINPGFEIVYDRRKRSVHHKANLQFDHEHGLWLMKLRVEK